jgi:pimeloyl-ACP methyl ester carboxylesterase
LTATAGGADRPRLHALEWGDPDCPRKVLALHGWMDNAGSFTTLGPAIAEAVPSHVVALSFPGHGLSSWLHPTCEYSPWQYVSATVNALLSLGWLSAASLESLGSAHSSGLKHRSMVQKEDPLPRSDHDSHRTSLPEHVEEFLIVGHSMGASIGAMVSAALGPTAVAKLAMIEGIGLLTVPDELGPRVLASSLADRGRRRSRTTRLPAAMTLEEAATKRIGSVTSRNDGQHLSLEAATSLLLWGVGGDSTERVSFAHDPRLRELSLTYLTEKQLLTFFSEARSRKCLVLADRGWPWPSHISSPRVHALAPDVRHDIRGGHHPHIEPQTQTVVRDCIVDFFNRN